MPVGSRWLALLASLTLLAACVAAAGTFPCETSSQCLSGGVAGACEPAGFCSFPDPACASGRRYAAHAAPALASQCTGDEPGADAQSIDGAPPLPCDFDGELDEGEECDDGDDDDDDGCVACRIATCGDGIVRAEVEECDPPGPSCTSACVTCPAPAVISDDGHCWELVPGGDYGDVEDACELRPGGHVASATTETELYGPLREAFLLADATYVFLGLHDRYAEGDWYFTTGEPAPFIPWAPGEPDGEMVENCAVVSATGWVDYECSRVADRGLCEREPPRVRPLDQRAYRRDYQGRPHAEVAGGCGFFGGAPAVLADAAELAFVRASIPSRAGCAWIGGTYDAAGRFTWDGPGGAETLPWASGEPQGGGGAGCLCVKAAGLGGRPCTDHRDSVCEVGD